MLADGDWNGEQRQLMLWANRNGFFYVLDRASGEFLAAMPFAEQTWAHEIDADGRPRRNEAFNPSERGTMSWPGSSGAANWPPPGYSPETGLFYTLRLNRPSIFFKEETPDERVPGQLWTGSAGTIVPGTTDTALLAIDPLSPAIRWETSMPNINNRGQFSGLVVTPEIIFAVESEGVFGLDAESGEMLWSARLGGAPGSPPATYTVGNRQYLTLASGTSIYTFSIEIEDEPVSAE